MAIGEREKQMGVSSAAEMVNRGRGYGNRGERKANGRDQLCRYG